jgi:mannose/fructose/N-acetylgalactosamine-specific phosphotransferase system component IIC
MLCPSTLVASITATGIAISEGKTTDEIALLGVIFSQLGDTLSTIAQQQSIISSKCDDNSK